jgi:hypothetical protein
LHLWIFSYAVAEQTFLLQICGYAIVEVLSSSCRLVIADI